MRELHLDTLTHNRLAAFAAAAEYTSRPRPRWQYWAIAALVLVATADVALLIYFWLAGALGLP